MKYATYFLKTSTSSLETELAGEAPIILTWYHNICMYVRTADTPSDQEPRFVFRIAKCVLVTWTPPME